MRWTPLHIMAVVLLTALAFAAIASAKPLTKRKFARTYTESKGSRLLFHFTLRRVQDSALLARIGTGMVLMRNNGDLVYLMPEALRPAIERMIADQPAEQP